MSSRKDKRKEDEAQRLARRAGAGDLSAARRLVKLLEERQAAKEKPEISEGMLRLFEIEIANEDVGGVSRSGTSSPGGANPATLGTALDSVRQGLEVDDWDMDLLEEELEDLIRFYGEDEELSDLVPPAPPAASSSSLATSHACEFCDEDPPHDPLDAFAQGFCSNCGSPHCDEHAFASASVEWDQGETDLVCERCQEYEQNGMTPEWARTTGKGLRLDLVDGGTLEGMAAVRELVSLKEEYDALRPGELERYRGEGENATLEWLRENAGFEVTDAVVDFVTEGHGA